MSKPFFLTRQTANLMEDFVRELKGGSSLFLLYGDAGVGKTRLLQELRQNRLTETRIHALDLKSAVDGDTSKQDRSAEIEALFASAEPGDVVIADHFEMALQKTRHQLFLSWSTDGIDKNLNLIIAGSIEGFNELRQLAQQYQVRVQSFQLMPFSSDEVEAFLAFYLFPDQPGGRLKIPAPLRKQLGAAQGNVKLIIEIADRDGAEIGMAQAVQKESIRQGSRIVFGVLALFVVAVGVGWYFFNRAGPAPPVLAQREAEPVTDVIKRTEPAVQATAEISTAESEDVTALDEAESMAESMAESTLELAEPVVENAADETPKPELAVENADPGDDNPPVAQTTETEQTPETMQTAALEQTSAANEQGDSVSERSASTAEIAPSADDGAAAVLEVEPGTVPESEAVIDESQLEEFNQPAVPASSAAPLAEAVDRFDQELAASRSWLEARGDQVGTIQILLLRFATFDDQVYYTYVDDLARGGADVTQLRIFKTLTGGSEVYSVFYGEFDSRQSAFEAMDDLPQVLKDTSPIPRSVGGIRQEIRRLGE